MDELPKHAFDNDLSGNTTAVTNNDLTDAFNASGNWWGSNAEGSVAASVVGPVDFTPYLDTGTDVGATFSNPKYIEKLVLLRDTTSNVPGFDFLGDAFIKSMTAKGMRVETTDSFLA